ncbi:MAG TPA: hypothetical protein VFS39_05890, partial [Nitrospira sp.]|nr:hypothetical protein [Nitrospira sp.]
MRRVLVEWFEHWIARYGPSVLTYRSVLVVGTQLALVTAANVTAFALRFDADISPFYWTLFLQGLPVVLTVFWLSLTLFGIQQGLWRYVGLHDLGRILWASVAASVGAFGVLHGVLGWVAYPRSVIILTGLLGGLYLAGIRL